MKKILALLALLAAFVLPSFAANAASLKGTYAFELVQLKTNGTQITINTDGGPNNPPISFSVPEVLLNVVSGTLYFNGEGTVTFKTIAQTNGGGGNGPKPGSSYHYAVSGNTANFSVDGSTISLSLGQFNGNLATSAIIVVTNTGNSSSPLVGAAILE